MRSPRAKYLAWVRDEVVLVGLLGAALILFVGSPGRRGPYDLPSLRLFLDTAILLVSLIVCVLAYVRFGVDRRRFDLYLLCGFFVIAATTLAFAIAPVLDGGSVGRAEAWARIGGRLTAAALIAAAPFTSGRIARRVPTLLPVALLGAFLWALWVICRRLEWLPLLAQGRGRPDLLTGAVALQAVLGLVALVGFGLRYRAHGEDLDRWLAFCTTIWLFAELQAVFTPPLSSEYVSQSDFLRLLSYAILLVGVWRAIRAAEVGRVVAEERARVAREIHDGLAQYLFAVSTQTSLLAGGADPVVVVPRLRQAADAAQQEARFAVLALSSAGGSAPFDSALNRYVEFLTADGELDVDLRDRACGRARPGRADRDLPDRPGRPGKRPPPRQRTARDGPDRLCATASGSSGSSTTATASSRRPRAEDTASGTSARARPRSAAPSGWTASPAAARRSRSCCAARGSTLRRCAVPRPGEAARRCGARALGRRAAGPAHGPRGAAAGAARGGEARRRSRRSGSPGSAFSVRSLCSLPRSCARSRRTWVPTSSVSSRRSASVVSPLARTSRRRAVR